MTASPFGLQSLADLAMRFAMGSLNLWGRGNSSGVRAITVGCATPAQRDTG